MSISLSRLEAYRSWLAAGSATADLLRARRFVSIDDRCAFYQQFFSSHGAATIIEPWDSTDYPVDYYDLRGIFQVHLSIQNEEGLDIQLENDRAYMLQRPVPSEGGPHGRNFIEIMIFLAGGMTQKINGALCHFKAGDVLVYDRDCTVVDLFECEACQAVNLYIDPLLLREAAAQTPLSPEGADFIRHIAEGSHRQRRYLLYHMKKLRQELAFLLEFLTQEDFIYRGQNRMLLTGGLARLLGLMEASGAPEVHSMEANSEETMLLIELKRYIDRHCDTVTTEILVKKFKFNRNYYNRLIQADLGISLSKYIQRVRVEKACQLLLTTNEDIRQIAQQVGYENTSFFYRIFREKTGKNPKEFRRVNRIGEI